MEKIKITNANKFEKLVEEFGKTPSLAREFQRGSVPNKFKEQLESVANALNALGPGNRTSDGWQKFSIPVGNRSELKDFQTSDHDTIFEKKLSDLIGQLDEMKSASLLNKKIDISSHIKLRKAFDNLADHINNLNRRESFDVNV